MQRYEKKNAHTNKLLHINQSHQFYFPPLALALILATILMASLSHFLPLGGVRGGLVLDFSSPSGEFEGNLTFDLKE